MYQCVWYRKDLRVGDHPALTQAMQQGPTVALFVHTPEQWQQHHMATRQRHFIESNLVALRAQLAELNVPLLEVNWQDFANTEQNLANWCQANQIGAVHCHQEPELNERRRDAAVSERLSAVGIDFHQYHGDCLLPYGAVTNQSGAMYRRFTPYRNAAVKLMAGQAMTVLPVPVAQAPLSVKSQELAKDHQDLLWPAGEGEASKRLTAFAVAKAVDYQTARDTPSIDGTSSLSPYLALGVISPKQCLAALISHTDNPFLAPESGAFSWLNELIWRDFYRHLLVACPSLSKGLPFVEKGRMIRWNNDPEQFKAWCRGETGYPLVDAAMRQLLQTGWMHNRLRMVVASFLTKHLMIDWRWGERFFSEHLVDGDLAANNGGWQWSASTGCDAQPYFRMFNPIRQSEKFDPKGIFIRNLIQPLGHLTNQQVHMPDESVRPAGYPPPLVEHSWARARALDHFSVLGKS
ncbi:deoxyribodipyrimidine photo-lyase [Paraferrimonas sedimenticola]|uniref:Deoxyribodipyrimidine photo-lyase n=1 Tax=Paraferrimonas sedimenticola TaxID=375674 RepID=A0AA37RWF4_9GAMM|nr:deoxyribodipyrimidine photo-lyase [Paraferrimonas sedimenticola]GLP96965.1 deoxyribodipyrimidine photo-lyase [Paraferrimonas sedimenticola]